MTRTHQFTNLRPRPLGHAGPPGRVLGDAGRSAPPGGAAQKIFVAM